MAMIMAFDQGKPESQIYDEAAIPTLTALMTHFKGVKIVSTQPLVIETYDDSYYLDAEWIVKYFPSGADGATWWPNYAFGEGPWHTIALGALAEQNKELAFTADKADALQVDQINMVAGPSLEILKKYLDQAASQNYIPFAPTMSQFVTSDESKARWENLSSWYARRGHFWVNSGPFSLDKAFYTEKVVTLVRNAGYQEPSNKWTGFGKPKVAQVAVDAPSTIKIGAEASIDVAVTYDNAPYTAKDIDAVKYLVFDEKGELVASGEASAAQDGQYQLVLSTDVTAKFEAGSVKVLVAVLSRVVALPTFETVEIMVGP
jgi:peptide/nickel transport system substrate-binding protein